MAEKTILACITVPQQDCLIILTYTSYIIGLIAKTFNI